MCPVSQRRRNTLQIPGFGDVFHIYPVVRLKKKRIIYLCLRAANGEIGSDSEFLIGEFFNKDFLDAEEEAV